MQTNPQQAQYSTYQLESIKRRLRNFYVLIGATGLILAWLSVGLPPSTWWLLIQAIRRFNELWAVQGVNMLWSFLLLVGQSFLLLAAWALLIRVAICEHSRLSTMLSQSMATASSLAVPKLSALDQPEEFPMLPLQSASRAESEPLVRLLHVTPEMPKSSVEQAATPLIHARKTQVDAAETLLQELRAAQKSQVVRQHDQPVAPQKKQDSLPESYSAKPEKQQSEIANDPFAWHDDILETFMQGSSQETIREQPEQTSITDGQDSGFVFGDPFEGPLPDVFEHDEDLKRSMKQQNSKRRPGYTP